MEEDDKIIAKRGNKTFSQESFTILFSFSSVIEQVFERKDVPRYYRKRIYR